MILSTLYRDSQTEFGILLKIIDKMKISKKTLIYSIFGALCTVFMFLIVFSAVLSPVLLDFMERHTVATSCEELARPLQQDINFDFEINYLHPFAINGIPSLWIPLTPGIAIMQGDDLCGSYFPNHGFEYDRLHMITALSGTNEIIYLDQIQSLGKDESNQILWKGLNRAWSSFSLYDYISIEQARKIVNSSNSSGIIKLLFYRYYNGIPVGYPTPFEYRSHAGVDYLYLIIDTKNMQLWSIGFYRWDIPQKTSINIDGAKARSVVSAYLQARYGIPADYSEADEPFLCYHYENKEFLIYLDNPSFVWDPENPFEAKEYADVKPADVKSYLIWVVPVKLKATKNGQPLSVADIDENASYINIHVNADTGEIVGGRGRYGSRNLQLGERIQIYETDEFSWDSEFKKRELGKRGHP